MGVAFPRLDDGKVRMDRFFQHVFLAVEYLGLLAFGQLGAKRGAGVEARDAGATGAQLLGQRALWGQVQFEFTGQRLSLELLVLAHVGCEHALDLVGLEQRSHAEIIDARVVADNRQVFGPRLQQCADQILRDAAQAETAGSNRHAIKQQAVKGFGRARGNLVHCHAFTQRESVDKDTTD